MKVTRAQAEANREKVVAIAAREFRARGFDGVSIAGIMKRAGLTHGGFSAAFGSKAALAEEACRHALEGSRALWQERLDAKSGDPLPAIVKPYLSASHRDNAEGGCLYAALAADVARSKDRTLRGVFTNGLRGFIERLTGTDRSRERAILRMSAMVGALVLSRAVDDAALSDEILGVTRAALADAA